jgi:hypothetical protein
MIREHQFRGENLCTYRWDTNHGPACGKPREEHAEIAYSALRQSLPPRKVHLWSAPFVMRVHNVPTSVKACTRRMCFVKWWPNRGEPLGDCQGL